MPDRIPETTSSQSASQALLPSVAAVAQVVNLRPIANRPAPEFSLLFKAEVGETIGSCRLSPAGLRPGLAVQRHLNAKPGRARGGSLY